MTRRKSAIDAPYQRGVKLHAVRSRWTQYHLLANAMAFHGVCTTISPRTSGAPGALIKLSLRWHDVCTTSTLRSNCALIRAQSERQATAFILSMSKRNTGPLRSRSFHDARWRCHRVAMSFVALEHFKNAVRAPPWFDRGLSNKIRIILCLTIDLWHWNHHSFFFFDIELTIPKNM